MRPPSPKASRWLILGFGVLPTGALILVYGPIGLLAGVLALRDRQLEGAVYIGWVATGAVGLAALSRGAKRFGASDFRLSRWEAVGIICGLSACIPFLYYRWFDAWWIYLPVVASAISGLLVAFKGAVKE